MEVENGELLWPPNGWQCCSFTLKKRRCKNFIDHRIGMPGTVCYVHYKLYYCY